MKRKHRSLFPKTQYSQLTTIDEDLIALKLSTTLKAETHELYLSRNKLEEPT